MACCILILIFIMTELSFDRFHDKADNIYRLGLNATLGERIIHMPVSNNPAGPVLVRDYAEVENMVRFRGIGGTNHIKYQDHQFTEEDLFYTDHTLFEMFTFPLLKGDPKTALTTANSVVISQSTAEKIFGDEDPMGKVLSLNDNEDFTITGVCEDTPFNSHIAFNMLFSFETLAARNRKLMDIWLNFNNYTYLQLREGTDYKDLEAKFPALVDQYMGRELGALGGTMELFLQPLPSIHLHSQLEGEIQGNGNILYVFIFAAIAVFILLIACINFMNLATARSATRAREVSLRKVVGAHRGELIRQFLGETVFFSIVALALALLLVKLALPFFSSISGIAMKFSVTELPWLLPAFLGLILFVGLAAGSYPALFLSSFQPATVLKGSLKSGKAATRFRSILVVAQFIISIALIIGTSIILNQIRYMKKKDLGFTKTNVIISEIRDAKLIRAMDSIKTQIQQVPGVMSVASSDIVPGGQPNVSICIPEGMTEDQSQIMENFDVDHDFFETLGIEIIMGRNFSQEFGTDDDEAIIVNEAAVKKFGWDDPIGKTVRIPANYAADGQSLEFRPLTVVGVVKDYHLASLHKVIAPQVLEYDDGRSLTIKLDPRNQAATIEAIKAKWAEIDPSRPFYYSFLDETFDSQYRSEERLSDIFGSFTVFAIFIACLGLFGMASYTAEQKTREIGIRKVLGASIPGVIALLSREFVKLVVVANLIAWPIAYFVMNNWLQNFAYRSNITLWIFLLTGLTALAIALITVSYQSVRAALLDPVTAIKYE
jgi:putative ABC transport system permease protein